MLTCKGCHNIFTPVYLEKRTLAEYDEANTLQYAEGEDAYFLVDEGYWTAECPFCLHTNILFHDREIIDSGDTIIVIGG